MKKETHKMNLTEAIAYAKQKENEFFRLTQLKKELVAEPFPMEKFMGKLEEFGPRTYNDTYKKFLDEKLAKIGKLNQQLEDCEYEILYVRSKVNKANVEKGLDILLVKMKWVRIQLDNLMGMLNLSKRSMMYGSRLNTELYTDLGLGAELTKLEDTKRGLDAKIQKLNLETVIVL